MAKEETLLYLHIWRKAIEEDICIPCASAKEAAKVRFGLYNAVKGVRTGKLIETKILESVEACGITFDDEKTLRIGKRVLSEGLRQVALETGFKLEEALECGTPQSEEELAITASARAFLLKMTEGGDKPAPRVTHYYTRD